MQTSELVTRFNFCKLGEDGVLEFYCDHSLLSALRACESYFMLSHTQNVRKVERNWNLEFGQWMHSSLEMFYWHEYNKLHRINDPSFTTKSDLPEDYQSITKGKFLAHGLLLWDKMEMDAFKGKHKTYETLHGPIGAMKLLTDYWNVYGEGKERLRVVGIELPFGREKEVVISDAHAELRKLLSLQTPWFSGDYRAYLTGRIDLLVDDTISVMPFDHKSTAFFSGDEATKFNPHDGMLGYAFAANELIKKIMPDKRVSKVLINHVALADNSAKVDKDASAGKSKDFKVYDYEPARRFTRSAVTYTPEQFKEYKLRQAASFDILYQLLVLERPAQWNTSVCSNMYHKECPYRALHGLSPKERDNVVRNMYQTVEEWNPFYESKAEIV